MVNMTQRTAWVKDEIRNLRDTGRYVPIRTLESPQGARIIIAGKEYINMCSNNYLGLANHPEVKKATIDAVEKFGVGAGAVRSIAGTNSLHIRLEEKVAAFKHMESSLVYQGGLLANLGTIPVLVGKDDIVFSEELNHASIIDGVRLSSATRIVYKHLDTEDLRTKLKNQRKDGKRALIITDGVFSMDGDIAPLDRITELGEEFDAMVYVDDAHGEGVLGKNGRGIVDHFGLAGRVDIEMGTYNVLEAGLKKKLSKIMIPSTIGVFGKETPKRDVPVDTVTKPRTMYGVTKVATEILGSYYFYRFGLDVRGLRFPGLISYSAMPGGGTTDYSVEMFHYAIADKKYTCFLKEDTMLPMMYMPDAINAFLQLYETDISTLTHHTDYNISAFSFTPKDLENAIQKRIPEFAVEYAPDFRQSIADSWPETIDHSEASKDWGFSFKYDLKKMVDDMITNLRKLKRIEIKNQA